MNVLNPLVVNTNEVNELLDKLAKSIEHTVRTGKHKDYIVREVAESFEDFKKNYRTLGVEYNFNLFEGIHAVTLREEDMRHIEKMSKPSEIALASWVANNIMSKQRVGYWINEVRSGKAVDVVGKAVLLVSGEVQIIEAVYNFNHMQLLKISNTDELIEADVYVHNHIISLLDEDQTKQLYELYLNNNSVYEQIRM